MGLRMEKLGAEEMEVKLFLFTVLQIRLFSLWSTQRPAPTANQGGWEALAVPSAPTAMLRLEGQSCAPKFSRPPCLQQPHHLQAWHPLFNKLCLPFCSAEPCLEGGRAEQNRALQPPAGARLLRLCWCLLPSLLQVAAAGLIFPSEGRKSNQKRPYCHLESWRRKIGWMNQNVEVW